MGNSFRCCLACILPCGALDVARVVHADGRIDEYRHGITAREVMDANPKHVLAQPLCEPIVKKPSLHPDTELQKGKIYFLIPTYTLVKASKPKQKPIELQSSEMNVTEKCSLVPQPPKLESQAQCKRPRIQCERPQYRANGRRIYRLRDIDVWKPVLESIPETDETLLVST